MPLKVGVIGCGYWGPNIVRNFEALKDCKVEMVADLSPENLEKIKKFHSRVKTTQNYRDILKDPEITAVAIITQAASHYGFVKESLEAGKHVFVEKPMTINAWQGKDLVLLAEKKKRILMVGHVFEYNPAVNKIKEILKRGDLGKILFIYSKRVSLGPVRSDVSCLWDFAFHDISIITYLLGKNPTGVWAWGKAFLKKGPEDLGFINLEFSNNVSCHIEVSWLYPVKERGMTIIGEKKMLVYNDLDKAKPISIYDYNIKTWKILNISYPKVEVEESLYLECRHFIDCLKRNKIPLTDGKRGVKVVEILEAVQKSLDLGGEKINVSK